MISARKFNKQLKNVSKQPNHLLRLRFIQSVKPTNQN
jgi:hypothetical protein